MTLAGLAGVALVAKMIDDSHQKTALGIVVAFPVLGGIAVLLRAWSRSLTRSRLGGGTQGS